MFHPRPYRPQVCLPRTELLGALKLLTGTKGPHTRQTALLFLGKIGWSSSSYWPVKTCILCYVTNIVTSKG